MIPPDPELFRFADDLYRERVKEIQRLQAESIGEIRRQNIGNQNDASLPAALLREDLIALDRLLTARLETFEEACRRLGRFPDDEERQQLSDELETLAKVRAAAIADDLRLNAVRTGRSTGLHAQQAHVHRHVSGALAESIRTLGVIIRRLKIDIPVARLNERGVGEMRNVFLCHSSTDKEVVRRLAERLAAAGVRPWFDEWEIRAGDSLTEKISAGIGSCDAFVFVVSNASINSRWVQRELGSAIERLVAKKVKVIPARLDFTPVPALIGDLRWTDLSNFEIALKEILDAVLDRTLSPRVVLPLPLLVNPFGLSDAALRLGSWLLEHDTDGYELPDSDLAEFIAAAKIEPQDAEDAARELEDLWFASVQHVGGQTYVGARHGLASALPDAAGYRFEDDLRTVATALKDGGWKTGEELLRSTGLSSIRLNRAVLRMKSENGAEILQTSGTSPFAFHQAKRNHRTRKYSA